MTEKRIKVLHVVLSMETGGLENGIVNLINHSDQSKFEVDVLCLRSRGELADRITNPLTKVLFDGNSNPSIISSCRKVVAACKDNHYQIVHSHGFSTMLAIYLSSLFIDIPTLINGEHGTLYFDSLKKRFIQKFLFKKMDINLTVSTKLKKDILEKFKLTYDNFLPIINGVDTNKFSFNESSNYKLRQSLNIPINSIVIGSVGRLVPGKNYKSLIIAFREISKKISNVHLVLAGDGPEYEMLSHIIDDSGLNQSIHLLGRRSDIPSILCCFDLFVLPSKSEGLSNTLLEAMSTNLPVIACDVGGNPEIVLPDISGVLYESDNVEQLISNISILIENPALIKSLSSNARKHILKNHSLTGMVSKYEDLYADLIEQNKNACALIKAH